MSEDELVMQDEPEAPPEMEEAPEPAASEASLILKRSGAETDEVFPLHPPSIVGRFDPAVGPIDVDLGELPEGVYISRKHAKITLEDGAWTLHDLGSSNGTFILRADFERIEEAELAELRDQLSRKDPLLEPVADLGQHVLAHECAHGVPDRTFLVVEQGVDREEVERVERGLLLGYGHRDKGTVAGWLPRSRPRSGSC